MALNPNLYNEVISLLNENKVKMMTKMAIYEKNEGKKMLKTAKYYKSDYVGLGLLKTVVATTIAFLLVLVLMVACDSDTLIANANKLDYASLGKTIAIYYCITLLVFIVIAVFVYSRQYTKSRNGLKKYFARLNKLEHFYNSKKHD